MTKYYNGAVEPMNAAQSLMSTLALAKRAWRVRLFLFVVGCVGLGLAARRIRLRRQRRAALAEVEEALRSYTECMLGAPLADGERASARLELIELGLPEVPSRNAPQDAWPMRCREDAGRAHLLVATHDILVRDPLVAQLDSVIQRAHTELAVTDTGEVLDQLNRAASTLGVDATPRRFPSRGQHLAPPATAPLTHMSLSPLPVPTRSRPDETASLAGTLLLSFVLPREERWTCGFSGRLHDVRCGEGILGAGSVVRDAGGIGPAFLRTMTGRFDRFELVRQLPDADPWVAPLAASMDTVALYQNQLIWVAGKRWHARSVPPGKDQLGPSIDLGDVLGASPEIDSCQTKDALLVHVKAFDFALGEHKAWMAMAALERDIWTRTPGFVAVDVGATFTCDGHEGTWTWFDRRVITQVRCNADRCETRASAPLILPWDVGGPIRTVDLAGQPLIVGLGVTTGPFLGKSVASVRMRLAPLAAIDHGPDVVLFGDEAHGGATVTDTDLYVRDGTAVVLLTTEGTLPYRAIRVDSSGSFEAVKLAN